MKNLFKIIKIVSINICILVLTILHAQAARVYMEGGTEASSNRSPMSVSVFLDAEEDTLSAVSGTFSFPTDLFDVKSISTQNGIVSMWVTSPHISTEKLFDGRTSISFEGIMPGGFSGVLSPNYKGTKPGILFTVLLIPKNSGTGRFLLDNVGLHSYDSSGTLLASEGSSAIITVPPLTGKALLKSNTLTQIDSKTLVVTLSRNELIDNNSWYLMVNENEVIHSIDHIEIAETSEYDPIHLASFEWHTVTVPYILFYQSRNKYIHTKVVYTDNTFAINTLPPVENSQAYPYLTRILLVIVIAVLLLYRYDKNIKEFFSKFSSSRK